MTTSTIYHTQGIRGFRYIKTSREVETEIYYLESTHSQLGCPCCRCSDTKIVETPEHRSIQGVPIGLKKVILRVQVRRIRCARCGSFSRERLSFCPRSNVSYTKWLAKYVLALRREMSITSVAKFTGLDWDSVKDIEKLYLAKKYHKVSLRGVKLIGIDEVYLGHTLGFITVVRDIDRGTVLFIGKGKGGEALEPFRARLHRKRNKIKAVTMDMSNAYAAWISKVLPDTDIVYDHFHVIKLMNTRMDTLRRSTMNALAQEQKQELKGKRYLFLCNEENLSKAAKEKLKGLRLQYADLGTASIMKESLRNIYKIAEGVQSARDAFNRWCEKAEVSAVNCLKQMARTIRKRMDGLLTFWKHDRLTSASQEGFNNKIGWLTRQAYGYRDEKFLHLKIFDLPKLSTRKQL